jgi:hypothetical protein
MVVWYGIPLTPCADAHILVNTRCVFHRLEPSSSHENNMTLCPLLDFLNHTNLARRSVTLANAAYRRPRNMTLTTPATVFDAGEELYLKYGSHPNRTLFVEYGFIIGGKELPATDELELDAPLLEADIQTEIEDLLHLLPSSQFELIKTTLEKEGYWGDWTLHLSPSPPHPSYRVIACLRLYSGKGDRISELNEIHWRASLSDICKRIALRASAQIKALDARACTSGVLEETVFCIVSMRGMTSESLSRLSVNLLDLMIRIVVDISSTVGHPWR